MQTQELLKNSDLLQEGFDQLKSTSVDVVHFVFGKRQLRPKGSGFLIPQKEGFKILGALFDFDLRQIKEGDLLSVFIKGAKNPKEEALFELKKVFKKLDEPTAILHTCYKDKIFKCQKGNLNAIQNQEKFLKAKGIFLLGAYPRVGVADVLEKADEVNKEALFLS